MCVRTVISPDGIAVEELITCSSTLGTSSSSYSCASPSSSCSLNTLQEEEQSKGKSSVTLPSVTASEGCPFRAAKNLRYKEKYEKRYEEIINREINNNQEKVKEVTINHDNNDDVEQVSSDFLALMMIKYRLFKRLITEHCRVNENSKLHRILFTSSQPGHVIMIVVVLSIISAISPSSVVNKYTKSGQTPSRLMSFIYLTAFVMHYGAQIWMTFVSGLSLYFALPRHAFNDVQRVLFPRYFTINACLSFITLIIFVKHHPIYTWDAEIAIQVMGMSIALFLELFIRLYFTPPLLRLMIEKKAMEFAAGNGSEIGYQNLNGLKHCPHYMRIHKSFRKTHSFIAIGNIITMACTTLHLYYIANKICVLI